MAFAQASGPPASARQVERLLALLRAEGHADFRDARGPMGFSQRQAGGRFTRDEAAAYIDQLEADDGAERPAPAGAATAVARPTGSSAAERAAAGLASEVLAAELQRRGWMAIEPLEGS